MQINNYLDTGGIIIRPNFFKLDVFNNFIKYLNELKHIPTYQPSELYYGNRYQAYPCYDYEISDSEYGNIIKKEIEKFLDVKIKYFKAYSRKILMEEIKKSQYNRAYGAIHQDDELSKYAAVLHLDQSFDGGTAFFERPHDNKPDIYLSAFTNRLVLYKGKRFHAPCNDFTFEVRNIIAIFLDF